VGLSQIKNDGKADIGFINGAGRGGNAHAGSLARPTALKKPNPGLHGMVLGLTRIKKYI
jgi:hypothetical protein